MGSSNVHVWTMTSAGITSQGIFTFYKQDTSQNNRIRLYDGGQKFKEWT